MVRSKRTLIVCISTSLACWDTNQQQFSFNQINSLWSLSHKNEIFIISLLVLSTLFHFNHQLLPSLAFSFYYYAAPSKKLFFIFYDTVSMNEWMDVYNFELIFIFHVLSYKLIKCTIKNAYKHAIPETVFIYLTFLYLSFAPFNFLLTHINSFGDTLKQLFFFVDKV